MPYCILRTSKLSTFGNVAASGAHNYREQDTPNADASLTPKNQHIGAKSSDDLVNRVKARIPENTRKNAVVCIEYLVAMSPEAMKDPKFNSTAYFQSALEWLRNRHGRANVVAASIHNDEKTPHLVAYVVPISRQLTRKPRGSDRKELAFEEKLNARKFLGGKKVLSEMQSDFAEKVGKKHGLERGVEGSRAHHKTVKAWYGEQKKARELAATINEKPIPMTQKVMVEKPELDNLKLLASTANTQNTEISRLAVGSERSKKTEEKAIEAARAERKKRLELEEKIKQQRLEQEKQVEGLRAAHSMEVRFLEGQLEDMGKISKEMLKATANLLKAQPKSSLARLMGVELVGKADIFDAVQKAGKAHDFESAVVLVAQAYNQAHDARISELARWAVDYENDEPKGPSFGM